MYLNLEEDFEYKSLYGEKNPQTESDRARDAYLNLYKQMQEQLFHSKKADNIV